MVWALSGWPHIPSTSAEILSALKHLIINPVLKDNFWMWCWTCAHNLFGQPRRGLFCVNMSRMGLAPLLQLTFKVLAILQSWSSLYTGTILFFFFWSFENSLSWGAKLNFQYSVIECESDINNFNTFIPLSHLRPCNTHESHKSREGKWQIQLNLDCFTSGSTHFCCQQFRYCCVLS